ncbi:hypothetical protein BOTBODRAFT_124801 [Botryobasidium botryosum FD-172 SS1]|uniref:Uncharacterized protein n=1 Tax=Botryobasidium botryosum (strain FD-172 SS1) TaxID=930990 RepID=A0A067N9Y4_BOTB1|nr:hypothetical protein BOTBODRAFT_124801 [Botryobasidium botryosum FD-172 SS1]
MSPSAPTMDTYFKLARLHLFPAGADLMYLPPCWGIAFAAHLTDIPLPTFFKYLGVFSLGISLFHAGMCVYNDIIDVEYDRQVERTKTRPLAAGIISIPHAWLVMAPFLLASAYLARLSNDLGSVEFYLGMFDFGFAFLYPFLKRWTYWPQAYLGIAANWGIWLVWPAIFGHIVWDVAAPLAVSACWTLIYDTMYGLQDAKDDAKAGVKSTALLFGKNVKPIISGFALRQTAFLAYAGMQAHCGLLFWIISIGGALAWHTKSVFTLKVDDMADCWKKFANYPVMGYIVLAGITLDAYCPL